MRKLLVCLLVPLFFTATAIAQDNGALLDLLVRKKVLTAQEAEEVRAQMVQEAASTTAGKIKLNDSITELKLGGDLRLRYQYDNRDPQLAPPGRPTPTGAQRSRWRFRLRLNADFQLGPQWFGGVQLVTGHAADSDNQTYQDGFSDYDIYISRAFLGWKPNDWFTCVAGKQPNPFYTTDLVWDGDINPTGLSQQFRFHNMFVGERTPDAGLSKDGKSIATAPPLVEKRPWELTLNLGELLYDDNFEDNFDNDAATDAYMFVAQLVGTWHFGNGLHATLAPGVMFFTAADLSGFDNENPFSDVDGVSGETRKLVVITAPGDLSWKWNSLPVKLYWDFAWNTQGRGRFDDIYGLYSDRVEEVHSDGSVRFSSLHSPQDDFAWLVGLQLGQNKKAGDWSVRVDYRHVGISSVDPNLTDSDFALGELNTRGIKSSVFYNFTDSFNFGVSYFYAWNLRDHLFSPLGDANAVQVLQVDANLKF